MPSLPMRVSGGSPSGPVPSYDDSVVESASTGPQADENPSETLKRSRRRVWLQKNPQYFGPELEAAEPQLYNTYIRRFQSAEEREAEGRAKGHERYAQFLMSYVACPSTGTGTDVAQRKTAGPDRTPDSLPLIPLELERDDPPGSRAEARERWRVLMEYRFVAGLDSGFPYQAVDVDPQNDDMEEQSRKLEDEYFSEEAPAFEIAETQLAGQTGIQDY